MSAITHGQLSEIDAILALTKRCSQHMRDNGIDQWDEDYPDYAHLVQDIETNTLFAYRDGNDILGIIVLNEAQDEEYAEIEWLTSENTRNLVVHRLAVDPIHQGKGIAQQLMDHAENYARQHQYASIRLDTFSQNLRNQRFYLRRGYTELGSVFLKYKKDYPYICYEFRLTNT